VKRGEGGARRKRWHLLFLVGFRKVQYDSIAETTQDPVEKLRNNRHQMIDCKIPFTGQRSPVVVGY
jgi:hypothetical protein